MSEKSIKVESNVDMYNDETVIIKIEPCCAKGSGVSQSSWKNCWTSSLISTVQDISEPDKLTDLLKIEPETGLCESLETVIKQELLDKTKAETTVCELYDDHDIKTELVIGPTAVECPSSEVLLQHHCDDSIKGVQHDHNYSRDAASPAADTGANEQSGDSRPTQFALGVLGGSEDEGCDVENAAYTCYFGDELLAKLMQTHTKERPYKCDVCSKKFIQKVTLQCHMLTHAGEKPNKCDLCGKAFSWKCDLKSHMRKHTKEKPHKCDKCGKKMAHKGNFNKHMRSHSDKKSYKCDKCGKEVSQKGNFNKHMRTHAGEKIFKCDVCGKVFTRKNTLNEHMRTHTGEKPYKCDVCSKVFIWKNSLNEHMRIHAGEKSYKCDMCGKVFSWKCYLKSHMRTHTGEKLYKCDKCGKEVAHKGNFNKHMRTHRKKVLQVS